MSVHGNTREVALEEALLRLGTESWRLLRAVQRVQQALDADQQRRIAGRISFYDRALQDELSAFGFRLIDFTGHRYGPQVAATAINADDFTSTDELIVDQTIEPAIVGPDGLVRAGTVTLRRGVS